MASTGASLQYGPNTYATSTNSVNIAPNPDGQSILQVNSLLQSQLTADDVQHLGMRAFGTSSAPAAGDSVSGSITSTLNTTPSGSTGTAHLQITVGWSIFLSDPDFWFTNTGFDVQIRDSNGNILVRARTPTNLENGVVQVTDASGTYNLSIDPSGDGITVTATINNVQDGDTFTITVKPDTETDGNWPGFAGSCDVSLGIDARVTVN